jgi:hypothetical protein
MQTLLGAIEISPVEESEMRNFLNYLNNNNFCRMSHRHTQQCLDDGSISGSSKQKIRQVEREREREREGRNVSEFTFHS